MTAIHDDHNEYIYRFIEGVMTVPSYMTSVNPNSTLVLDPDTGLPVYQEDSEVPFYVFIPRSLVEEGRAGAILQYGHGLLGSKDEAHTDYLQVRGN